MANFKLTVPLDASGVPDFKPEQAVRVVAEDAKGRISEQVVKLDAKGKGSSTFNFDAAPGPVHVIVGPENATATELKNLQTLNVHVSAEQWARNEIIIDPILIPPFYWSWWLRWCRTFTIRGRVLCPDGSPVPGAEVCAYDIDWWWWWFSEDLVGCTTTDATGSFSLTFRRCCGWWPWWWWGLRYWQLHLPLAERILPLIHEHASLPGLAVPTPKPDLAIFERMLASPPRSIGGVALSSASMRLASASPTLPLPPPRRQAIAKTVDPTSLVSLRTKLATVLPPATAEIERLRIWPWFEWEPWWDCAPDIIFKVTQNCAGVESVIVAETIFDARHDIPTTLDVKLTANDKACCIHTPPPPREGVCALLSGVCSETNPADLITNIGGNFGAPASPAGYQYPGAAGYGSDRPYSGRLSIFGQFGLGAAVDYYEFEYSDNGGATWNAMPPGTVAAPERDYFGPPLFGEPAFPPIRAVPNTFSTINGRRVAESRTHFESAHGPGTWGFTHFWVSDWGELIDWATSATTFPDHTYNLRVRTWTAANLAAYVPGSDPAPLSTILPICDTDPKQDNSLVITLDNRLDPDPSHPTANHGCGAGTVHECTREPDTHFIGVKLVQPGFPDIDLKACSIKAMRPGDKLQIDFFAHDPDGHLAYFELFATYGDSLITPVLGLAGPGDLIPGAPYTAAPTPLVIPAAAQIGPDYGLAVAQGAVRPIWEGGVFRLTVPAAEVFKEPCCYQLVLRAFKRTLACGDESFWVQWNLSEYSFMITF
jgi:hypothetical protein